MDDDADADVDGAWNNAYAVSHENMEDIEEVLMLFQVRGRGKRSRRHGLSFHGLAEGVEETVASF